MRRQNTEKRGMVLLLVDEGVKQLVVDAEWERWRLEEEVEEEEEGGFVDTHQRFIHSSVESGHRVSPNVPAIAPANLTQPALAPEPVPRPMEMVKMVVNMWTVVVVVGLPQVTCCVQEVFLYATLPRQRPLPACRQCTALCRTLAVDATAAMPVPATTRGQ